MEIDQDMAKDQVLDQVVVKDQTGAGETKLAEPLAHTELLELGRIQDTVALDVDNK